MDISYQFRLAADRLEFGFRRLTSEDDGFGELQGVIGHLRKCADESFMKAFEHGRPETTHRVTQPDIPEWQHEIQGQVQQRLDALSQLGINVEWS
jgi:hypothetical protein